MTVSGNEGMIWGVVTANHVSEINDSDFNIIPATNNKVQWDEVWYYTVEDRKKFGEEFKLMHDDLQRMKAFDIKCLPD
ncbi:MAG: hypothetical protein HKN87_06790 [Saprospiraceae bacterium]|nr:hypothetical protein [Saprospiraceae bacterium]